MNTNQRSALMGYWWPAACQAMGWNDKDRAKRLEVLSQAVGRPLESAADLITNEDFDLVKAHLLAISQPANFTGQVAIANMPRTRLLYAIRAFDFHPNYIIAISRNIFGTADWESLREPQLEKLRNTLSNRARAKARKGKDAFHSVPQTSDEPF